MNTNNVMTIQTLALVTGIVQVMHGSLSEANRGNPFITKSDAMRSINEARAFHAYVMMIAARSI